MQDIIERAKRDDGIPRTAQQSIPFQRMFPDGICRVSDRYYTKTIQYQDINYQLAQQEDKTAIFEEWCSFLNFFDSSIHFELSFMNMATDAEVFEKNIRIPLRNDHFNSVRSEYSQMLKTQLGRVKKQLNPKLRIEGILLTMVDNRTNYARDISLMVYDTYSASIKVFATGIPMSVRASEVSVEGGSIYSYDPKGKAAFAYMALTKEVLKEAE